MYIAVLMHAQTQNNDHHKTILEGFKTFTFQEHHIFLG